MAENALFVGGTVLNDEVIAVVVARRPVGNGNFARNRLVVVVVVVVMMNSGIRVGRIRTGHRMLLTPREMVPSRFRRQIGSV